MSRLLRSGAAILVAMACLSAARPAPAEAFNPVKPLCGAAGLVSGIAGKACNAVQHPGRLIKAGKNLLAGHPAQAFKTAIGDSAPTLGGAASIGVALAGLGTWVVGGAQFALHETASVITKTTDPQLGTTWFSSTYWRIAGVAAVLTLPFLFAAAIQALLRSDLALLARAALGYLPLAMLVVSVAAPLTMLLLSASDQLSRVVSSAAGNAGTHFLRLSAGYIAALSVLSGSPFLVFFVALFTVAGALLLWVELLIREAAVYVIVLMLPLAFAAFVWPARRVWAIRAVELLVALIVSKFAIVAVLSLGGAALNRGLSGVSVTGALAGFVLVVMAAFTPWALLRLLPLAELAAGATGSMRGELRTVQEAHGRTYGLAQEGEHWAASTTAEMSRDSSPPSDSDPEPRAPKPTPSPNGASAELERLESQASAAEDQDEMLQMSPTVASEGGFRRPPGEAPTYRGGEVATDPDAEAVRDLASERLPGWSPMWQRPDWSWPPLTLGFDDGSAPASSAEENVAPPGKDEHDSLPKAQEPQEGVL